MFGFLRWQTHFIQLFMRQCCLDVLSTHYHLVAAVNCFVAKSIDCRDRLWMMDLQVLAVVAIDLVMVLPKVIYQMKLTFDRWDSWCHHFPAMFLLVPSAHANRRAPANLPFGFRKSCNRPFVDLVMLPMMIDVDCRRRCNSDCYDFFYLWHVRFETKPWIGENKIDRKQFVYLKKN